MCYLCRALPGQGYGQRDNEHGRYDAPLGYVHGWDRVLLVHLTDVDLCKVLPGQGYRQRDNERRCYDAPTMYINGTVFFWCSLVCLSVQSSTWPGVWTT